MTVRFVLIILSNVSELSCVAERKQPKLLVYTYNLLLLRYNIYNKFVVLTKYYLTFLAINVTRLRCKYNHKENSHLKQLFSLRNT